MVTAEEKANQVLNEAKEEYIQALKDAQTMIAKLGLSRSDADNLEGRIIRQENARLNYEKARSNADFAGE